MPKNKEKAVNPNAEKDETVVKSDANNKLKIVKTVKPKQVVFKEHHTRNEIFQIISQKTNINKSKIQKIFEELNKLIEGHLQKRGSGQFVIPKIGIKIRRIKKKSTKERSMISPLTGKKVIIVAKPARSAVKLTALKVLKQLVNQ